MRKHVAAGPRRIVAVVAFALFTDYLIYGLLIPLTPYSPARAASEEELGMLYGAYSVGVLLATRLFGWLGDRIGYRLDAALCLLLLPRRQASRADNPNIWPLLFDRSVVVAATAVGLAAIGWGIIEPLLPPQLVR
jgi:MFS transporter, DHA1 family, solute carrier family 18 (vesicular amine transporter), member 1/2